MQRRHGKEIYKRSTKKTTQNMHNNNHYFTITYPRFL